MRGDSSSAKDERRAQWRERRAQRESSGEQHTPMMKMKSMKIWILESNADLKPATVRLGLNDNRYVEIIGGDLKEGSEVVIGSSATEMANMMNQQNNPFAPRMMGGGSGRMMR